MLVASSNTQERWLRGCHQPQPSGGTRPRLKSAKQRSALAALGWFEPTAKLLAHAVPQPPELRPNFLAAEFPLEPGDRVDCRVGT
jgi:hypothetical protein